ncbi:efflux transporter outer membrane subunit [Roseateles koreensis]|uniref:Efflux transporter outer membrane subunit n=1 Tax=Roseateles koreensis TaxID=2987526 RepID=A0ABT5KV51_9BURK|nr:efflux transporter outer membrane subunit [Roseateles koreensis]MDC8786813.1 efflux transporter outer membrane subunit [Roseateles koreensis]
MTVPSRLIWALPFAAALSACADLAPTYVRPEPAVASAKDSGATSTRAGAARDAADLGWREFFTEPRLGGTIELALANNRDLRVALLNVQSARAQYRIQDAATGPTMTAGAAATRSGGTGFASNNFSASANLSAYELDLFGRVKNLNAAALQSYLASDEARRSVQISLVAATANAWLNLAADLEREQLTRQTLASRRQSLTLDTRRHDLGAITGLAMAQSQSSVDSARVDLAALATQVAQDRHALELLLGAALPDALTPASQESLSAVSLLPELPAGVPSSVLQRRPDVLQAEHQLQASTANIGAARAALFPRIALTASAGTASTELSGLFKSSNGNWSFGPGLSVPIFDGGGNRANVEIAEVNRDIAVAQYDKAVQTAFKEVRDALIERTMLTERLAAQAALLASSERQLSLARAQFQSGRTGMLEVLDAERSSYAAQQALIALRLTEQNNRIALYKVLGGGWKEQ